VLIFSSSSSFNHRRLTSEIELHGGRARRLVGCHFLFLRVKKEHLLIQDLHVEVVLLLVKQTQEIGLVKLTAEVDL